MFLLQGGLPLSGNGNYWKQFPPPPATASRRLSAFQTSSRLSFMKKNETDSEVETSGNGGTTNIPLYNSTPADLVIEGNANNCSQANESSEWCRQGDNSVLEFLRPISRSKGNEYPIDIINC